MRLMVDANIVLDVLAHRDQWKEASRRICNLAAGKAFELFVSAHSVTTIHYIVRKLSDQAKAGVALSWLIAHFNVAANDRTTFMRAKTLDFPDFEDAVVAAAAESSGCDFIITRNLRDFVRSPVTPIAPEVFLSQYEHNMK